MLSDSSGLGIVFQNAVNACVNAVFPCHVRQDGTEALSIGTLFLFAEKYVGFEVQTAYTNGAWTIASPVPEPSTSAPLALGLAGLASGEMVQASDDAATLALRLEFATEPTVASSGLWKGPRWCFAFSVTRPERPLNSLSNIELWISSTSVP